MAAQEGKKIKKTKAAKEKSAYDEVSVYDLHGKPIKTEKLQKEVFQHKDNPALIAQYVRVYLNNQRQGTSSTKTRSEVSGTTKKMYKQKGTGRARHGAAKANLFRGGGVTFGPKPKEYSLNLNKKQKKQALFISLTQKARAKSIRVLDSSDMGKEPKTSIIAQFLTATKLSGKKVLFILSKLEKTSFVLSVRNIKSSDLIQSSTINPYEILNHDEIIFVDDSLQSFYSHFTKKNEN